ncbi:MAG: RloB family protein [Desulfobulbaceae bacterium]|nr:RloB family protein [Desulfobulbaceae bacterium]
MARRASYDTVLIVCEGEKTEPNYFRELRNDLKLNSANIEITGDAGGSSPMNIVNYAFEHYKEYDQTFCVFDKDRHINYQQALSKIRDKKKRKGHAILAITSVPCFEFWLLLHFRYSTKNFDAGPGAICDRVVFALKSDLPGYAKGNKGVYGRLKDKLPIAITNAQKVANYCKNTGTDHPSTQIHELVVYLQQLKGV